MQLFSFYLRSPFPTTFSLDSLFPAKIPFVRLCLPGRTFGDEDVERFEVAVHDRLGGVMQRGDALFAFDCDRRPSNNDDDDDRAQEEQTNQGAGTWDASKPHSSTSDHLSGRGSRFLEHDCCKLLFPK